MLRNLLIGQEKDMWAHPREDNKNTKVTLKESMESVRNRKKPKVDNI